ncbi:trypco2 family protein [Thermopolyspora sp. NPDC052614]|uniref:trypco2 family protein n=1 Tax=Thermopolyspora sp. NPDC052614 TaxID=3155682 RepID=UPI00343DE1C3
MADDEITVAIEQLRAQLLAAQEQGRGKELRFQITEVEMEFAVEVRKEGGGNLGLHLGLVKVGADGKLSHGQTHRLKLKLNVTDADGGSPEISGRR